MTYDRIAELIDEFIEECESDEISRDSAYITPREDAEIVFFNFKNFLKRKGVRIRKGKESV